MQNKWVCANCGRIHGENIFYCECGDTEKVHHAVTLNPDIVYINITESLKFYYYEDHWNSYDLHGGDLIEEYLSAATILSLGVIEISQYGDAQKRLGRGEILYGDFKQLSLFEMNEPTPAMWWWSIPDTLAGKEIDKAKAQAERSYKARFGCTPASNPDEIRCGKSIMLAYALPGEHHETLHQS